LTLFKPNQIAFLSGCFICIDMKLNTNSDKNGISYFDDVYALVKEIPPGRVTTYGIIADCLALGSARMVGWALNRSFGSVHHVPAHRVVNRRGELTGRNHFPTPDMMQHLLENEGVKVLDNKVVDFDRLVYNPCEGW
jgi:methylated-DNA-protein-cysteine methyltransferase related protein